MLEKNTCPICGKEITDILTHVRIKHDIESLEQLNEASEKFKKDSKKSAEFNGYVRELNLKLKNREITAIEFRRLRDEWLAHNT